MGLSEGNRISSCNLLGKNRVGKKERKARRAGLGRLSELTGNAWAQRHQTGWVAISVYFSYRNRTWGCLKEGGRN